MTAALITASAALVFICCLWRQALRRRRLTESAYVGAHRRLPSQPPSLTLRHATATAGTHGLGVIREAPAAMLLRRLGWTTVRSLVVMATGDGPRCICAGEQHEIVEIELPGGHLVQLTNSEGGPNCTSRRTRAWSSCTRREPVAVVHRRWVDELVHIVLLATNWASYRSPRRGRHDRRTDP